MSNEEFEFILSALEFIAIYGQRFLPLYHFDLTTGTWTYKKKAMKDLMMRNINKCNVDVLALANGTNAMMNIDHEKSKEFNNGDDKLIRLASKFALYMDSAIQITRLLPKFPSQRTLQEDEDLNFLHFRV